MFIKSTGGVVTSTEEHVYCNGMRPAVKTEDAIDQTKLVAVLHEDSDVSLFIGEGAGASEVVLSNEQAREFFTQALKFCE